MKPRLARAIGGMIRADARTLSAEVGRLWHRRQRQATIDAYLRSHQVRCLHIGAGPNVLPGWLNTDLAPKTSEIIYLDVTDPLPFNDNTLDVIFSEHLLEHLRHEDAAYHLKECCRVLRPSGRVRIATPDLQFLIDIYQQPAHTAAQANFVRNTLDRAFPTTGFYNGGFVLNHFVKFWGHQFIYDEVTLGDALKRAGFAHTKRWPVGQSDEPALQHIEHHGDVITEEFNLLQTIVMEGSKAK